MLVCWQPVDGMEALPSCNALWIPPYEVISKSAKAVPA